MKRNGQTLVNMPRLKQQVIVKAWCRIFCPTSFFSSIDIHYWTCNEIVWLLFYYWKSKISISLFSLCKHFPGISAPLYFKYFNCINIGSATATFINLNQKIKIRKDWYDFFFFLYRRSTTKLSIFLGIESFWYAWAVATDPL